MLFFEIFKETQELKPVKHLAPAPYLPTYLFVFDNPKRSIMSALKIFQLLTNPCQDSRFTYIESLANYKGKSGLWYYLATVRVCAKL